VITEKTPNNTILDMNVADALELIGKLTAAVAHVTKYHMCRTDQMAACERTDKVSTGYAPSMLTIVVVER
jgi:hypothetical protein